MNELRSIHGRLTCFCVFVPHTCVQEELLPGAGEQAKSPHAAASPTENLEALGTHLLPGLPPNDERRPHTQHPFAKPPAGEEPLPCLSTSPSATGGEQPKSQPVVRKRVQFGRPAYNPLHESDLDAGQNGSLYHDSKDANANPNAVQQTNSMTPSDASANSSAHTDEPGLQQENAATGMVVPSASVRRSLISSDFSYAPSKTQPQDVLVGDAALEVCDCQAVVSLVDFR